LLSRFQAGRMDDQRCTLGSSRNLEDKENQNANKLIAQIGQLFINLLFFGVIICQLSTDYSLIYVMNNKCN